MERERVVRNFTRLMLEHFETLAEKDVLDFEDGYSRILKPEKSVGGTALDLILIAYSDLAVANRVGRWRHVNHFTFKCLFENIDAHIEVPIILETGSSAHGTNSSVLFAALAEAAGGSFDTVDLNPATVERVRNLLRERHGDSPRLRCHSGDSVDFLRSYQGAAPNVVYLDSYDLSSGRFEESARHGLNEFEAVLPKLTQDVSFILVDDTPKTRDIFRKMTPPEYLAAVDSHLARTGRLPGKGELIVEAIRGDRRFQILAWEYQLLLRYSPAP